MTKKRWTEEDYDRLKEDGRIKNGRPINTDSPFAPRFEAPEPVMDIDPETEMILDKARRRGEKIDPEVATKAIKELIKKEGVSIDVETNPLIKEHLLSTPLKWLSGRYAVPRESEDPPRSFRNANMSLIHYDEVIKACEGEPFKACFNPTDADKVKRAVQIDSHLEGCFNQGIDHYTWDCVQGKLVCSISPESLAVLLRRLFEFDQSCSVAEAILGVLGFDEYGEV